MSFARAILKIPQGPFARSARNATFLSHNLRPIRPRSATNVHDSDESLFTETAKRWLYNERKQLEARRTNFNVSAMKQAACHAVNARFCTNFKKIDEVTSSGHRQFSLKFDNGRDAIVRIPNSLHRPAHFGTASEVATMEFVNDVLDIPVPRVLAWNSRAETSAVGAEYIIMEKLPGVRLRSRWSEMTEKQCLELVRQVCAIEARYVRATFTQMGSLYYAEDVSPELRQRSLHAGHSLHKMGVGRFCIGPSLAPNFWRGERKNMAIDRGPWTTLGEHVNAVINCEIEWIRRHAKPRPFTTPLSTGHSPAEHMQLLEDCKKIFPHITPHSSWSDSTLWHPNLHLDNILVSPTGPPDIVGILDWNTTWCGPFFLEARFLPEFQYPKDGPLEIETPPQLLELPEDLSEVPAEHRDSFVEHVKLHNIHQHYRILSTESWEARKLAFDSGVGYWWYWLRSFASDTWHSSFLQLRDALIQMTDRWDTNPIIDTGVACPLRPVDEKLRAENEREIQQHLGWCRDWKALMSSLNVHSDGAVYAPDYISVKAACLAAERQWDPEKHGGAFPFREGAPSNTLE